MASRPTSRAAAEIKALAKKHSKAAIKVLAAIMNQADGPATARVSAAQAQIQDALGGGMLPSDPAHGIMVSWFAPGQEMDYKQHGDQYRDFGNFNYGAVGTALGITPYELHGAAGVVQMKQKHWDPGYGIPFISGNSGDNQQDHDQIEKGIAYARAQSRK